MKKRLTGLFLALLTVLTVLPARLVPAAEAAGSFDPQEIQFDYFYQQLNDRAKAIYKKLYEAFSGSGKDDYYDGKKSIDLIGLSYGNTSINEEEVAEYVKGNKELFNDFCAAKDALDLDHSELWWIDSGYLTFRVTQDTSPASKPYGGYHVLIGPGRGETYLLGGGEIADLAEKIAAVDSAVSGIVTKAKSDANNPDYSDADKKAALVRSVHNQIVERITYRYEIECSQPEYANYIRTLYAAVTHEGVCEAYARMLQVCLRKLGIPCVLVHGLQTKGTPEDHMWNAVRIDDGDKQRWYAVDATWDDPLSANYDGTRDYTHENGKDGKENTTYLLVGQDVIGQYWVPSGYVSTGNFEFAYPAVEMNSYEGATAFQSENGLTVMYSAGSGSMEDDVPAGVFKVSFQGMGQTEAAKEGFYFLMKMYDYHADGTFHAMNEWYYCSAALKLLESNDYFYDTKDGLQVYTGSCEYVEVAVTTIKPETYDKWADAANFQPYSDDAFFTGSDDQIIAQTGLLYNVNSNYEASPYVYRQTPIPNAQGVAGYEYRFDVLFDDALIHPADGVHVPVVTDSSKRAGLQNVRVSYTTLQQDLRTGGTVTAQITGELPFDKNRDGYVDMPGDKMPDGTAVEVSSDLVWHYVYGAGEGQKDVTLCPRNTGRSPFHVCDVTKGCPIDGVAFNFRASDLWQDDITEYLFQIEGVVGSRSGKFPNSFGVTVAVPGLCPACYRSQGIDWNLWGKPTLLDAPENLDLREMAKAGGTDSNTLGKLDEQINKNGFNGRLMLVVEDKTPGAGSRQEYEEIENALEDSSFGGEVTDNEVVGRSVFEINFNRICPMVNLKPGQSLRVQVGYPAGVTYEDLTREGSDIELKAYHFTRCDAEHPCDEYNKAGHKDGQHIVGVNEITLIPTPYGMVILCDSFSPFEIVAVKKASAAKAVSAAPEKSTVVVVSDPNGVVKYNNGIETVTALRKDGNVEFSGEKSVEFTVEPKTGFVLDSVSLGGETIEVQNNKFTLTAGKNVTKNDVLSVTFIPDAVKKEEAASQQAPVAAQVCTHANTLVKDSKPASTPSCTEAGYSPALVCQHCGQVVTPGRTLPATGHTPVTEEAGKAATCTENGQRPHVVCSECGAVLSKGTVIEALGHSYGSDGRCLHCGAYDPSRRPFGPAVPEVPDKTDKPTPPPSHPVIKEYASFSDVQEGSWYLEDLKYVYTRGIIMGYPENVFLPEGNITRGQMITFLARYDFVDGSSGDDWLRASTDWAVTNQISDGTDLESDITREQFVTMLWRYYGKPASAFDLGAYEDAGLIQDYAVEAFRWAVEAGIINGVSDTFLDPTGTATRAQAAAIFARFARLVEG